MSLIESQRAFLIYELGLLSLKASLSTRAGGAPIYDASCKEHQRGEVKDSFREVLVAVQSNYANGNVSEDDHIKFINATAELLSTKHSGTLHRKRFRFGVCQKLVNIHLKYLWVAGFVPEPPHCPIDGIVRDLAKLNYDWTTSDSHEEYASAVSQLRELAAPRTLAVWELEEFRRRAQ